MLFRSTVIAKFAANQSVEALVNDIPLSAFKIFPVLAKQILLAEAKGADLAIKNGKKKDAKAIISALITEIQIGVKDFGVNSSTPLSKSDILKALAQILQGL